MVRSLQSGILCLFLVFWLTGIHAQESPRVGSTLERYERAMALYRAARYAIAEEYFCEIENEGIAKHGDLCIEAAFFRVLCVARLDRYDAAYHLQQFLDKYPSSTRTDDVRYELGRLYYNNKRYKEALRWFESIDGRAFDVEQLAELDFKRAYVLFVTDRLEEANPIFARLKEQICYYQAPATYYYAHIAYSRGHYNSALENFKRIDADPVFAPIVPYYIAQIYYKQENYRQLTDYIAPMIDQSAATRLTELQRMLGEAYFHLEQYDSAAKVLDKYAERVGQKALSRDDNYLFGLVHYRQKEWAEAAKRLERVVTVDDSVSQNAYYHLADCYLHLNDTERAQKALGLASEMDYDKIIQEDALFNYAKLLYEHRYNPFSDAVSAFTCYLELFPHSLRKDEAYTYLGMAFMGTQNYQGALNALSKIGTTNATTRQALQRAAYYRGVEYFQSLNFTKADSLFSVSLRASEVDHTLRAKALYWRAEANYRLEQYAIASQHYQQFLLAPGAFSQPQYPKVPYDLGYAYFKMKNYAQAVAWFRKYTDNKTKDSLGLLTDALVRLGDCLYIQRKYWPAIEYYQKANKMGGIGADYALYQEGCVYGLVDRPNEKIRALLSIGERYPESMYRSHAYFEVAETYHLLENLTQAKEYYQRVVTEFPSSSNAPASLLQLGLVYYEEDNYDQAIQNLEHVVSDYAGTAAMHEAIVALERVYQAKGDVKPYLAYLEKIGQADRISHGKRDSLFYTTAETQYMSKQFPRARMSFEEYLREYPQGAGSVAANYYLADCLLQAGDTLSALPRLEVVIARRPNQFYDRALYKAAPIYELHKDLQQALQAYLELERSTADAKMQQEARYGKLRMAVQLKDDAHITEYANSVLADDRMPPEKHLFARYHLGMMLLREQRYDLAYNTLALIGDNTGAATGAEARYRMAEIRFLQKDWEKLQDEVFTFAKRNTPHQYWLAKAFILLADSYREREDFFQAKATLQSILDNYSNREDGIRDQVQHKMNELVIEEHSKARTLPTDTIQFQFAR